MPNVNPERRRYQRWTLACPITVYADDGEVFATGKTVNVSDGGALLVINQSAQTGSTVPLSVNVQFKLPRTTANTCMFEPVATSARVVRSEPLDSGLFSIALEFLGPIELELDA